MKTFTVTYAVRGYFDVTLEAENIKKAQKKADEIFCNTEFSNLIDPTPEYLDSWEEK